MKMESPETEIFRLGDDSERLVEQASVDAEFVFCQTCGDVVVGMGVDIRIHAQGYGGSAVCLSGTSGNYLQLFDGFDIEAANSGTEGEIYLCIGFTHTGKTYFFGCRTVWRYTIKYLRINFKCYCYKLAE